MLPDSTGSFFFPLLPFFLSFFFFFFFSPPPVAHMGTIWEKICNLSLHQTTQVKRLIPSWVCQQSAYSGQNVSSGESGGGMFLAHTCRSVSWGASNTMLFGSEGSLCACPLWSHSKGLRLLFTVNGCGEWSAWPPSALNTSFETLVRTLSNWALSHPPPFELLGNLWGCGGRGTGCDSLRLHSVSTSEQAQQSWTETMPRFGIWDVFI